MSPRGFPQAWAGIRKMPACLKEDETTLMMARWLGKRMFDAGWRAALKEQNANTRTNEAGGAVGSQDDAPHDR